MSFEDDDKEPIIAEPLETAQERGSRNRFTLWTTGYSGYVDLLFGKLVMLEVEDEGPD